MWQEEALETQLRLLLFEQEFHVKAEMCYTVKLVDKKIIATQELEIEAPSEEKANQHQAIAA